MTVTDTPSRKYYKALRLRSKTGRSTGIGIIEYSVGKTLQLASLYYDCQLTNREAFEEIVKYVESLEMANLRKSESLALETLKLTVKFGTSQYEAVDICSSLSCWRKLP